VGEAQNWLFEPDFNRSVKVGTTDERIPSDAGLLLLRLRAGSRGAFRATLADQASVFSRRRSASERSSPLINTHAEIRGDGR
jgi:hypothetical protein